MTKIFIAETEEDLPPDRPHRSYKIFLATPYDPIRDPRCKRKFRFYDALGKELSSLYKDVFLSHKDIDLSLNLPHRHDIYQPKIQDCDVFIADISTISHDVRSMCTISANEKCKSLLIYHEPRRYDKDHYDRIHDLLNSHIPHILIRCNRDKRGRAIIANSIESLLQRPIKNTKR